MSIPTDPRDERPETGAAGDQTDQRDPEAPHHPRGYTLADEEIERIAEKSASGDVLDPIALDDPVGQSVEKVVLRVGIAVVAVLVAGILLAQIACKNIQLSGITDFSTAGVSVETVERALGKGITWGGEIVHFPADAEVSYDAQTGTVTVTVGDESARTAEQLAASAQARALALAMNLFRDEDVQTVTYVVRAPVSEETGMFSASAGSDAVGDALTVTWQRDSADPASYSCTVTGFDPVAASVRSGKEAASNAA